MWIEDEDALVAAVEAGLPDELAHTDVKPDVIEDTVAAESGEPVSHKVLEQDAWITSVIGPTSNADVLSKFLSDNSDQQVRARARLVCWRAVRLALRLARCMRLQCKGLSLLCLHIGPAPVLSSCCAFEDVLVGDRGAIAVRSPSTPIAAIARQLQASPRARRCKLSGVCRSSVTMQ